MKSKSYPYYPPQLIHKVNKILKSGKVNYWTGNEGKIFEKEFSKYIGNKYSVAVTNGSVALEIALKSLNLNKNDHVIVTPRSFIISASCVINCGLKPVFADVDHNGNLSIEGIKKVYSNKIKAIIVVHLNGMPCDLDPILKFSKKFKIKIIEDCSQAHGAVYKNRSVGSFGDISTWSFCQDKIISTGGEGGMISTNNKKLWEKCWSYKDHGKNYYSVFYKKHKLGFKWLHENYGTNHRMTEVQAAIGRYQLKYLDTQIKKRNQIAKKVMSSLNLFWDKYNLIEKPNFNYSSLKRKIINDNISLNIHAFYRLNFYINLKRKEKLNLLKSLQTKNVNCNEGPCPEIYKEKVFKKSKTYLKTKLVNAIKLGRRGFVYHINPFISDKKLNSDIKILRQQLMKYVNV